MKDEDKSVRNFTPWKVRSTKEPVRPKGGETKEWSEISKTGDNEIAIFIDGSMKKGRVGFGIVAYTKKSLEKGRSEWEQAGEMEEKNVLDAEMWAIIKALQITKKDERRVKIYTDSRNARE